MISVQIVGPYDNTPMWWRNFVNAQQERCEEMNHSPNLMQQIIQSLAEYDITYSRTHAEYSTLTFHDDMKYTWFMLRWS